MQLTWGIKGVGDDAAIGLYQRKGILHTIAGDRGPVCEYVCVCEYMYVWSVVEDVCIYMYVCVCMNAKCG